MSFGKRNLFVAVGVVLIAVVFCVAVMPVNAQNESDVARSDAIGIFDASGVQGGLVVHLGCGNGRLTAALKGGDAYIVHGLDANPANVDEARRYVQSLDAYGPISIDPYQGDGLPYADNVVNLLVVEDGYNISQEEVLRVLAPLGVAYLNADVLPAIIQKPWPNEIDEWTHYMHDASNNGVANDSVIAPPKSLQWQCGPTWSRHHDHMSSITSLVSAKGRVFYVLDEGSRFSPQLPSDWKLIARDGFNGVKLWSLDVPTWHDRLWPLKSGPANLPRRVVAIEDEVYVTLGIDAPVSALDAATGETIREYVGSDGTEEILCQDGVLLALVNRTPIDMDADLAVDHEEGRSRDHRTTYSPAMARIWAGIRSPRWSHGDRIVRAYDAASGEPIWDYEGKVLPLTLTADADRVYFHNGDQVAALDLKTGEAAWTSEPVPVWQGLEGQGLQSWFAPTLVASDGKNFFAGGEKIDMSYVGYATPDIGEDTMTALDAATGEKIWTAPHPFSGYNSPEDLFVAQGQVWNGTTAKSGPQGRYTGFDMTTGEVEMEYPPTVDANWFHHRCYRAKATENYILSSRTGIEFVDLKTGEWTINHWIRGACLYGIMPCNGLIYSPPEPCACYPEAKINGFSAVTATAPLDGFDVADIPEDVRLMRGPAYGRIETIVAGDSDWPTYRGDVARSGGTDAIDVTPTQFEQTWKIDLDGAKLTQPIAVGDRVYIADVERCLVYAIDATSGEVVWEYNAGGRVDSVPTYFQGSLIFGAADGCVYSVRASDGVLAWRYMAAPRDRRIVAYEGIESLWPVHGAALVDEQAEGKGVVTAVAGRSMFLDGGLQLVRLDAATGRLLSRNVMDNVDPETGDDLQMRMKGLNMPVALPDILSTDGENLYMRSQVMTLEGERTHFGPSGSGSQHLFAPYGFLDGSWFHRRYWVYSDNFQGGVGGFGNGKKCPAGRLLVNNDTTVFGFGRKPEFFRWGSALDYHLYAAARPGADVGAPRGLTFGLTDSLDPTRREIAITAWVKPDAEDGTILVRGANMQGFALILTEGRPRMLLRTGNRTHEALAASPIELGVWTHVAGVLHEDGRMLVYVNGEEAGRADESVPPLSGNPSMGMKVGFDDVHQLLPKPLAPFRGALDEIVLAYDALSEEDVAVLADQDQGLPTSVADSAVLHLSFNRGRLKDGTTNANDGTLSGGGRVQTTEGPFGDALVLDQPKEILAAASGSSNAFRWTSELPILVHGMALGGKTLYAAGPAAVVDENAAFQSYLDPETQTQLAEQAAALRGERGATLLAVDANTGTPTAQLPLDSPPVNDGLIIADGSVFIATADGCVVRCDVE
jgi:outer membrane protein assembly factor BamB